MVPYTALGSHGGRGTNSVMLTWVATEIRRCSCLAARCTSMSSGRERSDIRLGSLLLYISMLNRSLRVGWACALSGSLLLPLCVQLFVPTVRGTNTWRIYVGWGYVAIIINSQKLPTRIKVGGCFCQRMERLLRCHVSQLLLPLLLPLDGGDLPCHARVPFQKRLY